MADEWYYAKSGEKHGPVSAHALKQLARSGEIGPNDLVWKPGLAEWKPANKVVGLHAEKSSAAIPPPPPESSSPGTAKSVPQIVARQKPQRLVNRNGKQWSTMAAGLAGLSTVAVFCCSIGFVAQLLVGPANDLGTLANNIVEIPSVGRTQSATKDATLSQLQGDWTAKYGASGIWQFRNRNIIVRDPLDGRILNQYTYDLIEGDPRKMTWSRDGDVVLRATFKIEGNSLNIRYEWYVKEFPEFTADYDEWIRLPRRE